MRRAILCLLCVVDALLCRMPVEAQQPGFRVLVWQYRTDARNDIELYRSIGLGGFHIDRGEGQQEVAKWAAENALPYYVDHAAGKGILHLTDRSGLETIDRNGGRSNRPWSFFDPATLEEAKRRLHANIPAITDGPVVAIALDDEVALGSFNSPLEVDFSDAAISAFSKWLPSQYATDAAMKAAWGGESDSQVTAATYEDVRLQLAHDPPQKWRLAPWLDFRAFMDRSQSDMFARLVAEANTLAPGVPAGVVGGQQPSAYGGFDYSRLRYSLQFIEAYDIGGTNELLQSFWAEAPRKSRMQTYFASGDLAADKWFLWYYLAHGCTGVIVWPEFGGKAWFENNAVHPHIQALGPTFAQIQSSEIAALADPGAVPLFSPIAVLYSHPSVHVGWAIDSTVHGKTWPRRSSSLDSSCLSSGKNRVAWSRLLEDLGHQPRFIDESELTQELLTRLGTRVLILPQMFALSEQTCESIKAFADSGGLVIADYGTAIVDQHGTGYAESPLDEFFGIARTGDNVWFDGSRSEVNGELYQRPFTQRLRQPLLDSNGELRPVEAAIGDTFVSRSHGAGKSIFINSSPTAYFDSAERAGRFGQTWRTTIASALEDDGVKPPIDYRRADGLDHGVELLRHRVKTGEEVWAFVPNPTRQAAIDGAGSGLALPEADVTIELVDLPASTVLTNLRTGERMGTTFTLPRDEAVLLRVTTK